MNCLCLVTKYLKFWNLFLLKTKLKNIDRNLNLINKTCDISLKFLFHSVLFDIVSYFMFLWDDRRVTFTKGGQYVNDRVDWQFLSICQQFVEKLCAIIDINTKCLHNEQFHGDSSSFCDFSMLWVECIKLM